MALAEGVADADAEGDGVGVGVGVGAGVSELDPPPPPPPEGAEYMNPPVLVTVCPSPLVTTTFAAPAEPAGVVAVIEVEDTKVTLVAATPPTVTPKDAPDAKPVPVMVIDVPPAPDPVEGEMPEIVGATTPKVPDVITRLPEPVVATATKIPVLYVTPNHSRLAVVRLVQLMPSG